jgi:hypothetical protein
MNLETLLSCTRTVNSATNITLTKMSLKDMLTLSTFSATFVENRKNIDTIKTMIVWKFILRCRITSVTTKIALLKSSLPSKMQRSYAYIDCKCTIEASQTRRSILNNYADFNTKDIILMMRSSS